MSRDGSGNYTRVPGSAYTNGTTADGAELDAEINDIATALTQSLAKDGQTVPTANLPMGGFKHTNVNTASARTEYARASQVQDGAFTYLSSVSGTDTITASAPIGLSAYAAGQQFCFVSAGANTGAVTLNINAIGAKAVTKCGATALAAGDIASGAVCVVVYDGTQFQLVSARVVSAASDTIAGVVELATAAEVQAGTDTVRAVTPAGLASLTATETRAGIVELATAAEAKAGTDGTMAMSPLRLRDALNASGSAPIYACRAWVNFNGTGTVAIRDSGNVSSITDNGVGDYTVNFTTAMPDFNYSAVGSCQSFGVNSSVNVDLFGTPSSTSSFRFRTGGNSSVATSFTVADSPFISVAIFR